MEPIILKNKGQRIFGILHLPKGKEKVPLVVLCHGWTGNHLGTWNAFFTNAARHLAKSGFAVFRFDFRGSGNSDGVFEKQTTSSMIDDLKLVITQLCKRPEIDANRIALAGHSQGAYIAILYTAKNPHAKALINWMGRTSDLVDFMPPTWIEEAKRKGYTFYSDGYTMTHDFIKDSRKYNSRKALQKIKAPIGMIYGGADTLVFPVEALRVQNYAKGKTKLKILKDLDHDFTGRPGIQNEVIKITSSWLKKWL